MLARVRYVSSNCTLLSARKHRQRNRNTDRKMYLLEFAGGWVIQVLDFHANTLGCAMSTQNSRMLGQVPQKLSIFESSTRWLLDFQVESSRVLSGKIEFSPKKLEKKCAHSRSLNLLFRSQETKQMAFQESISWLFNVILHIWCYKISPPMRTTCGYNNSSNLLGRVLTPVLKIKSSRGEYHFFCLSISSRVLN